MTRVSIRMRPALQAPVILPGRPQVRYGRLGRPVGMQSPHHGQSWLRPGRVPIQDTVIPVAAPAAVEPGARTIHDANFDAARQERATGPGVERSAQDTWYAVEDLWTRLSAVFMVSAALRDGCWQFTVRACRHAAMHGDGELLRAATDPGLFTWWDEGRQGSFVREIHFDGDDLQMRLASMDHICRWPQGDDLGWQVVSLMSRWRGQRPSAIAGHAG